MTRHFMNAMKYLEALAARFEGASTLDKFKLFQCHILVYDGILANIGTHISNVCYEKNSTRFNIQKSRYVKNKGRINFYFTAGY